LSIGGFGPQQVSKRPTNLQRPNRFVLEVRNGEYCLYLLYFEKGVTREIMVIHLKTGAPLNKDIQKIEEIWKSRPGR